MKKLKELIGMAAVTVLFSLFTWALAASYVEEYNLFSSEKATVTIVDKSGAKGLYTPPAYYVRVELPNGEESPYLNRISKKRMNELKIGDSITGYSTRPSDFSTVRDIVVDSIFYLLGIFALGFIAFCCLIATVLSIPALEQWERKGSYLRQAKRKRKRRQKRKTKKERNGWRIVGVVLVIFLLFLWRFLLNLIRKLTPLGKTQTEAMIFDRSADVSYRKYQDSAYELTIAFEDQTGDNIQVIKNVTRHTYQQYDLGDKLPIAYQNANPYDVFVRGTSFPDVLQALMTWELFFYIVAIAVTLFVGWAFYDSRLKAKWRKKKE